MEDISVTPIPKFKDYDINTKEYNESKNARQTFLRSILIFADRSISSMGINDLDIIFKNKRLNLLINRGFEELLNEDNYISKAIEHGLKSNNFNNEERNLKQTEIADEMVNKPFVVLGGPPGCGKTKIALQKIQKENPKKIFWVCPRINVCQAVFEELYREYTPDLTVEIFTGEFKQTKTGTSKLVDTDPDKYLSGDIVVITIDQILSILVKNGKAHNFIKVLDSHFVFDEFHEIFSIPGMVFIFKEMLFLFKNLNIPCLLMSATPNPSFLKKICSFFNEDIHLKKAWDFHDKDFLLDFNSLNKDDNSIRLLNEMDTIHIYNSIDKAQSDYLKITETNETLLFHSSFNKEDKQIIYKELMSNFGKKRNINSRDFNIVRAGPVIQASLNISAQNLITDVCSPENLIQRIGRCNRFGESNIGNIQILNYVNKNEGPIVYLQRVEFSKNSSLEFYKYLELQNKCNKRSDLMSMYYDFHKKFSQFYDLDWLDIEKEAFKFLKNFEERKYISKNTSNKNKIVAGFRGESLHILPIIVKQLSPLIFDTYIYDITKPIDLKKTLTLSSSDIDLDQLVRDYSGICTNSNFQKKYGMKNNKWNTKEESLKFKAKDPSTPIFVSYDDKDHKNDPAATNKNHNLVYVPFIKGMKSLGLISIEKIK
jgi:CRISPR-associated endonuclease/helicase Cas3